ncbi:hypothetical protein [Halocatena halophila]|uniref:hypothetical protein n=1 Tax=Halocatena halophila TaxID=2814576 RepID=UPI002ED2AE07
MKSTKVAAGTVTITDETIQIDLSPFTSFKRLFEQSKLIGAFFIGGYLMTVLIFVFDPSPYFQTLSKFVLIFSIVGPPIAIIVQKLRNDIASASEIQRSTVSHVEYTGGSRLFPMLRIIVEDGKKTGARPVPLSHQRLGGDKQLENAITAFEEAGISVVPADETPDENS